MNDFLSPFRLAPEERPAPPQRVLLVDDDPRLRASFRLLLEQPGRDITEADSVARALVLLQGSAYDLALLDIGLPDGSGLDILHWLKEHQPGASVLMVSGQREQDAAVLALRHGALDFLRKPDDLDRLADRVDQTLQRLAAQRLNGEMAQQMAQSERLHRFLVERSPDIVYTLDAAGRFVFVNPRIESLLGHDRQATLGRHHAEIVHEDDRALARFAFAERRADERASTNIEIRLQVNPATLPDLPPRYLVAAVSALGVYADGDGPGPQRFLGSLGVIRDITERKRAEETISFQALHDALTNLPNRRLFKDRLELALAQAERRGLMVGVMFIDLDRFKLINDTYGHLQGDELLRTFAQRLRTCVRAGDTVARQGGDEFTVLLPDLAKVDDALGVARKLLTELEKPFPIGSHDFRATASVGIAIYPRDGVSADQLMQNADIAMYQVKAHGRNGGRLFTADMNEGYTQRLELENELRQAIAAGSFQAHYQPQFSTLHGGVVGVELLIRWQHPRLGLLLPGQFIGLAEETGLICALGDWVLEQACRQLSVWHAQGHSGLRVAVNLSPLELGRSDIVERVSQPMRAHGVPAGGLEIEITENMLLEDTPGVIAKLDSLRQRGVRISIDDFGTRYSSLNYLQRLPINSLKIDQSFVRDLVPGEAVSPIIPAIVGIARGFGLHVVAEGVESQHQLETLQALGCDEMQGHLFGAPMTAAAVTALLAVPVPAAACLRGQARPPAA
jgi:diguanylate cyclase (GGDEF)-like protein